MKNKIFITGSTGCVGSYVLDQLLHRQECELHLFVRDPQRIQQEISNHPHVVVHVGNLDSIHLQKDILFEMTHIMHIATDWSDSDYARKLNLDKTHDMFSYTDPKKLQKIIYFSTASILGPGNKAIKAAGDYGQGYVKSKYFAYQHLAESPFKDVLVTVFPTLVLGGDDRHPFSHINGGLHPHLSYLKWLRFLYVDGAFHFLHSYDIAQVAIHLLFNKTDASEYVLGNPHITAKDAIETVCNVFDVPMRFRVKITARFVFALAKLLRIVIGPWERYCITHPYMIYDTVRPDTFGLTTKFPTFRSVVQNIKDIGPRKTP